MYQISNKNRFWKKFWILMYKVLPGKLQSFLSVSTNEQKPLSKANWILTAFVDE